MRQKSRVISTLQHRASYFNSSATTTLLEKGVSFHQIGNLLEAEKIYREVITANKNHPDALHLLGLIELQNGNAESAISLIQKAISINQ